MTVTDLNMGMVIKIKDGLFKITGKELAGHGKAARTVHLKLKDLQNGNNTEQNFKAHDDVETVDAHNMNFEFLYEEDGFYVFMNTENFEQHRLSKLVIGEQKVFLQPNLQMPALVIDGEPKSIEFPETVEIKVESAPDGIKGSDKEVVLQNGLKVLVPHFVAEGESVVIKTDDFSYVRRVTTKSLDNNAVAGTGDSNNAESD